MPHLRELEISSLTDFDDLRYERDGPSMIGRMLQTMSHVISSILTSVKYLFLDVRGCQVSRVRHVFRSVSPALSLPRMSVLREVRICDEESLFN